MGLSWLVPNHYAPWFSFHSETCMAVGMLLLAFFGASAGKTRVAIPCVAIGLCSLALIPIVQVLVGVIPYSGTGLMAALYIVGFAVSVVVGYQLFLNHAAIKLAIGSAVFLASALISVFIALYQWLGLAFLADWVVSFEPGARVFSNLAQPNHLATLLVWGSLANLYLFQQKKLNAIAAALIGVILLLGVSATQSRAGLLEGVVFLLLCWSMRKQVNLPVDLRLAAFGVVVMVGLALNWPVIDHFFGRAPIEGSAVGQTARLAAGTRPQHWQMLWDAIWVHPVVGWGWDQVSFAHASMALTHASGPETQAHSHNILLDLAIWNGIPVALVVIFSFVFWFKNKIQACRETESFVFLSAICVLLTHALFEYPVEYTYFLLPAGLMLGGLAARSLSPVRVVQVPCGLFYLVLGVVAVLVVVVARDYLVVESQYRHLRFKAGGFAEGAIAEEKAPIYLLSNLDALLKVVEVDPHEHMQQDELVRMKNVVQRYTYPFLLFKYAVAAGINDQKDEAGAALHILCGRYGRGICQHHLRVWAHVTKNQYPQLASVPMPVVPGGSQ